MIDHVRVNVRPVATPLPITFLGLMTATTVVAAFELRFVPSSEFRTVGWIMLAVPAPMQMLAAAWGFVTRSAAATTGSAVLSTTWLGIALSLITMRTAPPGLPEALGVMLFAAGAAMLVPVLAELAEGSILPAAVMGTASIRFFVSAVSIVTGASAWRTAAGYTGLVLGAVALYGALSLELESVRQAPVLPTLRRGSAKEALEQSLAEELAAVEHEPGLRTTL